MEDNLFSYNQGKAELMAVDSSFNIHNWEVNVNFHHVQDNIISAMGNARPQVRPSELVVINHRDGLQQWHFGKGSVGRDGTELN